MDNSFQRAFSSEFKLKGETPTRYRSLDTLTAPDAALPAPRPLARDDNGKQLHLMCQRQSTYTLSSTPDSCRQRNKTSSPIQAPSNSVLESLLAAEKTAEELRVKLSNVIKEYTEDGKLDSSTSSLALDVSKISVLKGPEASKQFASSPNLSGLGIQDEFMKRLKRGESVSTSNLATKPSAKDPKTSKLRRLSPNLFKLKSNPNISKSDKETTAKDSKNTKLNSLFKSKIVTPVRATKTPEASPNLSASRKKYSNVKSTIPRLASKKE